MTEPTPDSTTLLNAAAHIGIPGTFIGGVEVLLRHIPVPH